MYAKKEDNQWWVYFDTVEEAETLYKENSGTWECMPLDEWISATVLTFDMELNRYRRQLTDEFEVRESFEKDDPVCWCGVNGAVRFVNQRYVYPIEVVLKNGGEPSFLSDGKYKSSHKTPSLFHGYDVLRPEDQKFPVLHKPKEELKKQYEADAQWHPRPWELWETNHINNRWGGSIFSDQAEWFFDKHPENIRRKPDAPERNCKMCKHSTTNFYFSCRLALGRGPFNLPQHMVRPDWCPLAQKEEPDLLAAARDLLEWLDGFDLVKGADKVKALREVVDSVKSI